MEKEPIKLYLILNSDIKLSTGQIASQVAHMVHILTNDLVQLIYESYPVSEHSIKYLEWNKNPIVIIKKAPLNVLNDILQNDFTKSFKDDVYIKKSKTIENHLTIVGIYPGIENDHMMNKIRELDLV